MKINISNSMWEIIFTKDKKKLRVNGKICAGATHYREQKVYIDISLKLNQLIRVLTHEITHVIIYTTQICPKDTYTEEDMCELVALYGGTILSTVQEIIKNKLLGDNICQDC